MKHKSTLYTLAFCSLVLASCSDNDIDKGGAVPAGTEIQFGTSLTTNPDSRTYYDPNDVANGNASYWRIYWNYQADNLDKIFIYSPEANAGVNQATFTVDPEGENKYQATKVTKDGAAGIQTSDAASYRFFSLFPASAVTEPATGTKITANFKGQQNPTKVKVDESGKVYTLEADMDNCLMTASSTIAAADIAKGVGLQFKPFSTVLNIEVNGPTTGAATATITSVLVSSTSQISGKFSIDFSGAEPKCEATSTDAADKRIYVSTLTESGDGVQLKAGEKLNVRVFLLPNTDVNDLIVQVNGNVKQSSSQDAVSGLWKKKLTMDSFKPSQIHTCRLPEISTAVTEFDKSIWISQLDPRTYISEISLPGSAMSWNSTNYITNLDVNKQTQTIKISDQFNAGIRVFQAHCWLAAGENGGPDVLHLMSEGKDMGVRVFDVVEELTNEMKINHGNEFCVLMLSDYKDDNYGSWDNFYKRVKELSDQFASMGLLADHVNANTTINDVKGKVILKIQLNSNQTQYWTDLNGSRTLLNTYGNDAGKNVWYSQLTFGSSSIAQGGTNASGSLASWPMSFIYFEQANPTKETGLFSKKVEFNTDMLTHLTSNMTAYKNNYNSNAHKVFGMSYLGGNGASINSSRVTTTQVVEAYIDRWNTNIQSGFNAIPYGWVLFNQVGGTNTKVNTAVDKVINHNMRTLQKQAAPSKYTGSAGAANGGQLND